MSWHVRPASWDDDELSAIAALVSRVTPDSPSSVEEIRWAEATYPGGGRFVAVNDDDGRLLGSASVGRIYMYPPEFPHHWFGIEVDPAHRRQGIGSALLDAVSEHARAAGKTGLETTVSDARPDAIAFLEHRGFVEVDRARSVRLELAGLAAPVVTPPDGIQLVTLAERPDVVPGVHEVALLAFPDIPSADEPIAVGGLAEFRARDVDRPGIPPDGFIVALDAGTGQVVGYAAMLFLPGRTDVAWHDMTAVRPSHRGRGIATVLKQATIRWAIERGMTALDTGNDVENLPMRAVNARLGYAPLPDTIDYRGPLVAARAPVTSSPR